jgi:FMN phosphatase YigB (HAD superfamily)
MYPLPPDLSWTEIKLWKCGIRRYFEVVYVANEHRLKGVEDWQMGASLLSLPPERLMGFGDSIGGDIVPMKELGIRAMAVKARWKRSNGDLPEGVPLLDSLVEAPDKILTW